MDAELLTESEWSQYLIQSKPEIVYILQAIKQKHGLVTAYFNQNESLLLTSILMVEKAKNEVILDCGSNEALNIKMLESSDILFITYQDKVKVQFRANRVTKTKFQDRDAFCIGLPDRLLKLQRREYYRLLTPIVNPLRCVISMSKENRMEVNVVDISVGGIGIIGLPIGTSADMGTVFQGCRIMLPEIGAIEVTIEIRSLQDITLRSGAKNRRYGCRFVDAPESIQVLIQRYINKQEREIRSKLAEV